MAKLILKITKANIENYVLFETVLGAKCAYGCLFDWLFSKDVLFWGDTDIPRTYKSIQ